MSYKVTRYLSVAPLTAGTAKDELDEGEQATLRAVEEEARAEAEEKLVRVEAVAGAGLAHLSEMQGRVDEML